MSSSHLLDLMYIVDQPLCRWEKIGCLQLPQSLLDLRSELWQRFTDTLFLQRRSSSEQFPLLTLSANPDESLCCCPVILFYCIGSFPALKCTGMPLWVLYLILKWIECLSVSYTWCWSKLNGPKWRTDLSFFWQPMDGKINMMLRSRVRDQCEIGSPEPVAEESWGLDIACKQLSIKLGNVLNLFRKVTLTILWKY